MSLYHGDCLEQLKSLSDSSVDALVTDPPAGIAFMGKSWDTDKGGSKEWIGWMEGVMRECLRVMKPGAHGLVWAIPRTSHWTATALENAGFEIRDKIYHAFGSGFPKSLNISKAIDKAAGAERDIIGKGTSGKNAIWDESNSMGDFNITAPATDDAKKWDGFGTALKPAIEEWVLVRKPISEKTVAANVLKHGTGALNIDGSRVDASDAKSLEKNWTNRKAPGGFSEKEGTCYGSGVTSDFSYRTPQGRFPAHFVLSHSEYCTDDQCDIECSVKELDRQSGTLKSGELKGYLSGGSSKNGHLSGKKPQEYLNSTKDSGGASRFFYCAKTSTSERNAGLQGMPSKSVHRYGKGLGEGHDPDAPCIEKNSHPTVKPQKLMRYLCKLVTPPGGVVLDPFMGSGSTGLAALSEGFQFVGIEREKEYLEIARTRIFHAFPEFKKEYAT